MSHHALGLFVFLSAATACSVSSAADVSHAVDQTTGVVTHNPWGLGNGYAIGTPSHTTLYSSMGARSLYPLTTTLRYLVNTDHYPTFFESPRDPLPPNRSTFLGTEVEDRSAFSRDRYNIAQAYQRYGDGYRDVLANRYDVPIEAIPFMPDGRLGRKPIPLNDLFFEDVSYSYDRDLVKATNLRLTFDAIWRANDSLDYKQVAVQGRSFAQNVLKSFSFDLAGPLFALTFELTSTDNLGERSELEIFNMTVHGVLPDIPPQVLERVSYRSIDFFAAPIPEPGSGALMWAGLAGLALMARRRCRQA